MGGCVGNGWRGCKADAKWWHCCYWKIMWLKVTWEGRAGQWCAVLEIFAALGWKPGLLQLLSLVLVASILEPYLDLGFCQVQHSGELLALVSREVLLHCEASFQFVHLGVGEERPGPSLLVLHWCHWRACRHENKPPWTDADNNNL